MKIKNMTSVVGAILGYSLLADLRRRQRSEQYLTSSQHFSHFLRHVKGRSHTGQILTGRSDFLRCFAMLWVYRKHNFIIPY